MGDHFDGSVATGVLTGKNIDAERKLYDKMKENPTELAKKIEELKTKMKKHSQNLEFEEAAKVRDEVKRLQIMELNLKEASLV